MAGNTDWINIDDALDDSLELTGECANGHTDCLSNVTYVEPGIIPLQEYGVMDVNGQTIPDNELMSHALSNTVDPPQFSSDAHFTIRRSSAFINEYVHVDEHTSQHFDGGPSNANHLLGSFPVLFPYGMGGFEVDSG